MTVARLYKVECSARESMNSGMRKEKGRVEKERETQRKRTICKLGHGKMRTEWHKYVDHASQLLLQGGAACK